MAGKIIQAAGGIVVRNGRRPLVAVVQRSKDDRWVLPRGKLKRDENPVNGARREVIEETGHRVSVHEFLGAMTYRSGGRPKVVLFWHMHAEAKPSHDLMADIVAVEWLPLKAAARRLSYPLEKIFLRNIGRQAVLRRKRRKLRKFARRPARKAASKKTRKKPGANTRQKKRMPAPSARRRATAHVAMTKTGAPKSGKSTTAGRKTDKLKRAKHRTAAARILVTSPARNKFKPSKQALHKHAMPKRRVARPAAIKHPATLPAAAPDRSFASVATKPPSTAKRKGILQRMLGRLAG